MSLPCVVLVVGIAEGGDERLISQPRQGEDLQLFGPMIRFVIGDISPLGATSEGDEQSKPHEDTERRTESSAGGGCRPGRWLLVLPANVDGHGVSRD